MYPFIRLYMAARAGREAAPLDMFAPHMRSHICLPWDIDPWVELNNGRTLTLYDLGRMGFAQRTGAAKSLRKGGYGVAVAGLSVRYRKRIKMFDRFEMVTRLLGWDARFFYLEQSIWNRGECANHVLVRIAITSAKGQAGIVPPERFLAEGGRSGESPVMDDWVQAWIAAEALRPWPPRKN